MTTPTPASPPTKGPASAGSTTPETWQATRAQAPPAGSAPDAWKATRTQTSPGEAPEAWQATRAQTQIARDADAYLDAGQRDVGRAVGDNRYELFVSCDVVPALRQQFEHLLPEFIAIHDVATASSRKLIAGIAAASKGAVQRLTIRRQGFGTSLATLEFVELPTAEGQRLRIYSTETDVAAPTAREALARALLAYSTLGVILVGDVPGHSIGGVFKPLHDEMITGPWPNRHLLLLPLSTANVLVTQGMELARGTGVNVRTTPQVTRPADAWNFISSTWTRLRDERVRSEVAAEPRPPATSPTAPLPLRPMPQVPGPAAAPGTSGDVLTRYVDQLSHLAGMVSCCIFDVATGRPVQHAGARPGPVELGEHGAELLATMLSTSRVLGLGHALPEAAITLGAHHLLLRAVPRHPGLALHAVLDKTHANLTLARLQIGRMDVLFDETPRA